MMQYVTVSGCKSSSLMQLQWYFLRGAGFIIYFTRKLAWKKNPYQNLDLGPADNKQNYSHLFEIEMLTIHRDDNWFPYLGFTSQISLCCYHFFEIWLKELCRWMGWPFHTIDFINFQGWIGCWFLIFKIPFPTVWCNLEVWWLMMT